MKKNLQINGINIIFTALLIKKLNHKNTLIMLSNLVEIFYYIDEFCKEIDRVMEGHQLANGISKKTRKRAFTMSDSEVITIMIMFHQSHYRDFKTFYINHIQEHCQRDFPHTVSYGRFVELQQKALLPMTIFLQLCCLGKCTGISFMDSTPIRVCHIKREKSHKVFKGLATKGKSTVGWFFGFKLHLVINDKGEIIKFIITQANVDDREPLTQLAEFSPSQKPSKATNRICLKTHITYKQPVAKLSIGKSRL